MSDIPEDHFKGDEEYEALKAAAQVGGNRTASDWHNVMQDASGRRVIIDLLNQTGYMGSVFDKHNSEMCRNVGKSEIGFYIQSMLSQHAPKALIEIMTDDSNLFANDN